MGSRALSHDSIFLDDLVMTEPEPTRVLSQENVHSKIKALQVRHFFILGLLFKLMVTVTLKILVMRSVITDDASAAENAFGPTSYGPANETSTRSEQPGVTSSQSSS